MEILIEKIRVSGLRGLKNIEVSLEPTTILTGMNNSGKTSFLKAIQIAIGKSIFVTEDDFHTSENGNIDKITIDIKIIPVNEKNEQVDIFSDDWEVLFTVDRVKIDKDGKAYLPLRTIVSYDSLKSSYKTKKYILPEWPLFKNDTEDFWYKYENGNEISFSFEEVPFYYIDAQRDILEDIKFRNSYLGRMISNIKYSNTDVEEIEKQIKEINEKAVAKSDILTNIKSTLKELDTAMDTSSEGVEITPFTKKIRDLNKGLSIYYTDKNDSLPMEYHGMGTRSWSSLLTLKSFITLLAKNAKKDAQVFFPILAIEEPEAHLHPNAHKKLYGQIVDILGQKIISTHSPYIAASAELSQLRSFYKNRESVQCGKINTKELAPEDIRKIKRQVVNTRGELFFSKAIIFFEGESEEQALPIFAEKFFGKSPLEIGLDFVGVGGHGNYLPFLRVANALNIPWYIFSDGEEQTITKLKKDLKELFDRDIELANESNVFFLEDKYNFEECFLENDFIDEIKSAFSILHSETYLAEQIERKDGTLIGRIKTKDVCDKCNQNIYEDVLRNYKDDKGFKSALYDCMASQKTQLWPLLADEIIKSSKTLPQTIIDLFQKIKNSLYTGKTDE